MPPPFKRISLDEFKALVTGFPWTRKVNAVHMHHTWKPEHKHFRGHETIVGMWRSHTVERGFRDIAQHISIDPEGFIWLGRDWNLAPASAAGHNGNSAAGPFMFETIGNFDIGHDRLEGVQRACVIGVIATMQQHFKLAPESLMFHNMMASKSCPGTGVDRATVIAEVAQARTALEAPGASRSTARNRSTPADHANSVGEAIALLTRALPPGHEDGNAEVPHTHEPIAAGGRGMFDSGLTPAQLAALRPHLVNLAQGRLSDTGEFKSSVGDVDAIFDIHLIRALEQARARNEPLRIVFFAHGGLVSEATGLKIAHSQLEWWRANEVYPIQFVWETGFWQTLIAHIKSAGTRGVRDLWDHTTDPLIERTCRHSGPLALWGNMKYSAEQASTAHGGARHVARRLAAMMKQHPNEIELHAVGHSAGSIFHSHFIPAALDEGVPGFKTLQFLAPAIRCDAFLERLAPLVGGKGIDSLTAFTMMRDVERADNCGFIYRKSLLYLIHHALEPEAQTEILGLEESLRRDPQLKTLWGLDGRRDAPAELIWSPSAGREGRSASQATAHGDFDNDGPTMNSVLRRILAKADADPIVAFPASTRSLDSLADPQPFTNPFRFDPVVDKSPAASPSLQPVPLPLPADRPQPQASGRRTALCIGIDRYPSPHELHGCVADARLWAQTLSRFGFETGLLLDEAATREGMLKALGQLVDGSTAGDTLVIQFAGHGTQLDDIDGDEEDDGQDEALCPIDFGFGAFVLDDDLRTVIARLPQGVALTCFMDCCHSGTISRTLASHQPAPAPQAKARFIRSSPAMREAHRTFRAVLPPQPAATGGDQASMREVTFSACKPDQVAYENAGQGDFTRHATAVLKNAGTVAAITNATFQTMVDEDFGPTGRQNPMLDCAPRLRDAPLFGGLGVTAPHAEVQREQARPLPANPLVGAIDLLQAMLGRVKDELRD